MAKNSLDPDGQERLKKVLAYAQNDIFRVHDGIVEALRGVTEKGRRTYLWGQLRRRAERHIMGVLAHSAQEATLLANDKVVMRDAFEHEGAIGARLTEHDR